MVWGERKRQGNGGAVALTLPLPPDLSRRASQHSCADTRPLPLLGPECLEVSQHQAADLAQLIVVGGEQRWISAQHGPTLGAQNPVQVSQVALDGLEIGVLASEQGFDIPVGVLEFALQTLNACFAHELRSLPQQVQTRAIANL